MRQMIDTRNHQRREHLAVRRDAADRNTTHADAVVATFATNNPSAGGIATRTVVSDGHFERRIDRLGARVNEEDAILRPARQCGDAGSEIKGRLMTHLEAGRKIQRLHLAGDRLHDAWMRVTEG